MAGYITRGQEKSVVLSASQVDTLVNAGSGDAALLYLLLQRLDGPVTPEALAQRLGWSLLRCNAAETALQDMGFLQRSQQPPRPTSTAATPPRSWRTCWKTTPASGCWCPRRRKSWAKS